MREGEWEDQRAADSGDHAPEIPEAVKAPPVPFEDVRGHVSAPQSRDDPLDHRVDGGDEPSEGDSENDYGEGADVAESDVGAWTGVRIDVALVDVVNDVGRRCVDRGREVRHKGCEQTGYQEAEQAGWDKAIESVGENHLEVDVVTHPTNVVAEEDKRENREAGDEEVAWEGQDDVNPGAHHAGFAGIFAGENALHVVVRRGTGEAHEDALEEEHHDEEAEEFVAVLLDLGIHRADEARPVEIEMPAEEELIPAGGNRALQHVGRDTHHGDDADGDGGDREDAELNDLGDDDTEHAALDHVKGRDAHQDERVFVGG